MKSKLIAGWLITTLYFPTSQACELNGFYYEQEQKYCIYMCDEQRFDHKHSPNFTLCELNIEEDEVME